MTIFPGASQLPFEIPVYTPPQPESGVFDPDVPGYGGQLTHPVAIAAYEALCSQLTPDITQLRVDLSSLKFTAGSDLSVPMKGAIAAFVFDHPESQYCTISPSSYDATSCTFRIRQDRDARVQKEALAKVIADFRAGFDFSLGVVEQYRYIHDYICDLAVYDLPAASSAIPTDAHTAFGLLTMGKAVVCEGYSKAFKVLCDAVDLPCILAVGEAVKDYDKDGQLSFSGYSNHMWNMVRVDGAWYSVDTTWDDIALTLPTGKEISFPSYRYFLNNAPFRPENPEQDHRTSGKIYFAYDHPMIFALPEFSSRSIVNYLAVYDTAGRMLSLTDLTRLSPLADYPIVLPDPAYTVKHFLLSASSLHPIGG